jgi:general secretion pathway protein A
LSHFAQYLPLDEHFLNFFRPLKGFEDLGQFEMDSKHLLSIILAGQNNLLNKLMYLTSRSLSSRVISRSHLEGLKQKDVAWYLEHHLEITGIQEQLFPDVAILAIHQGSSELL